MRGNIPDQNWIGAHGSVIIVPGHLAYSLLHFTSVVGSYIGVHWMYAVRTRSDTTPVNPDPVPTRYVSPRSRSPSTSFPLRTRSRCTPPRTMLLS